MSTIKDVARLAGVGVATASRALSGTGSVSSDKAARVRAAADQLGYRPSSIARALSLQQSGAIGVYVPAFDANFYSALVSAIDAELRRAGRHMVVANGCGGSSGRQQAQDGIDFLIGRDCDGLLIACHSLHDEDLVALLQRQPNTVVINRVVPGHAEQCFCVDHQLGGRLAARALLSRGHRDIAAVCGPQNAPDNEARVHGFIDELARHGITVPPEHSAAGNFDFDGGDAAICRLLDAVPRAGRRGKLRLPFSAVFVANDVMALSVISRLVQAGLRVPQDVSVFGYDGADFAPYTSPPLTTLRMPTADVATNACRQVLNLCYGLALPVSREFPPEVVWRQSVADAHHHPPHSPP
jgi:LacI family transcriptional regulator